ncbi:chitin-binding domain protein cbd-1-like [Scaptodrosophila lebanonensis]|uniref:Chitin-binding domain protein cbd-1-like n=1 Tax=Drosophila lebanonensis TaxID=7225 RepID=A0A6J2T7X3_DROLE|nr:chitin-binding domain protein cbd-1-like [Scaptodrosophila lebanonensis]
MKVFYFAKRIFFFVIIVINTWALPFEEQGDNELVITTTVPPFIVCDDGDEFLPAPNCREYYHCLYGQGVLKSCPENLYWEPQLHVCGWNSEYCSNDSSESPQGRCQAGVEFLPFEPDCRKYIQCDSGNEIVQSCPPLLYWNEVLQRCDYKCIF